ncbi:GxGYxYP family putative glycoside hydrolase [Stigmatella sp. ncwal1]|uniref:GxGYxYP family putative glycoside hydrolase n=1 Tax=Stigmatella ashevillensis TaxID=2995309 RepID=A0ABT5D053_9BACT|nr:GxGYxYP domain-containing protein [Stigmatella ashevillena]MDC0707054.1 GxGYxYP family putative glycoside hydrolase [Stigmatella ashevillena]
MKSIRWIRWVPAVAAAFAASELIHPQAAAAAGLTWPQGQVLPSFSTPAATLDLMDLTISEYKYEAEGTQIRHGTGHLDGNGWVAQTSIDAANQFLTYGPYASDIPVGSNTAFFDLSIDNNTANNDIVVTVDVRDNTTGAVLASRDITRTAFTKLYTFERFELPFNNPVAGHGIEFRIFWYGRAYIKADAVGTRAQVQDDEAALFTTLKGIVNRTQPRIFTYDNAIRGQDGKFGWLNALGLGYTEVSDRWSLLAKYRNELSGIVIYDNALPDTLNLATTIAGLQNGVAVSPALATRLTAAPYNLPILMDLRGRFTTKVQVYQYLYDYYWSQVTHKLIIGLSPGIKGFLRDYATAAKLAVVWLDPKVPAEDTMLRKFLSAMPYGNGGIYMGWWPEEAAGIERVSEYGISTLAGDFSSNLTVFGGTSRTVSVKPTPNKPPLNNKIYISLILSDGDNLQYVEHLFKKLWDSSNRGQVPLGWTISPAMLDAMPGVLNYLHTTATPNDNLISGPTGLGYTYPNYWGNQSYLDNYVSLTQDYMNRSGLKVVTVWNKIDGATNANVGNSFAYNAPLLLGLTAQNAGGGITVYNNMLPSQGLNATYCPTESSMVSEINRHISGWNGTSPRFVSIQANPWEGNSYQSFVNVVNTFSSNSNIVFVRPDIYFQLMREHYNLPVDPATLVKIYEAENTSYATSPFSHTVGRSNDNGWSANVSQDGEGLMLYGPYVTSFPAGQLTTTFKMKIDAVTGTNDLVATLDVRDATTGTVLTAFDVYRSHFKAGGIYQDFSLTFNNTAGRSLEFRAHYKDKAAINIDKVTTTTRLGQYEAEGAVLAHHAGRISGDGWQASLSLDAAGHMVYGPYDANVPVGTRKLTFRLKTDNNSLGAQVLATLDVRNGTTGATVASMDLTAQQFTAANQYQDFSLTFHQTAINQPLEYRVYFHKRSTLTVDKITVY